MTRTVHEIFATSWDGDIHSNADIAARLYMSEATVKAHVSGAMAKLGAANRVQVAITARDAGLA